jgi:hypothetical protein
MMRDRPIPLTARMEAITLAIMENDDARAFMLRGDLYVELLELIAHSDAMGVDAEGEDMDLGHTSWAQSISDFLKTEELFR